MTSGTKFMLKEQYSLSLGPKRAQTAVCKAMPCHSHSPLLSPASSGVSIALRTQTPLWDAGPSGSGPCTPPSLPHCGYVCNSSDPACLDSGGLACTFQTISLAHSDQQTGARRPPKFRGVQFTSVLDKDTLALGAAITVLLVKEPVPPAGM